MPKVNLGRNEAGEALTNLLWGRKAVTGMPAEEMAAIAGVSPRTMQERKKDPTDLTVKQLLRLGRQMGVPIEDLRAALKY